MNQEVKYTGFTAVPSDYDAADGQLAVAINVVPEDNELKPVFQPHLVLDLKCDQTITTGADGVTTTQTFTEPRVVYIHKTASIEHLIILVTVDTTVGDANATREYALYWLERDATEAVYEDKNKISAVTGFNHVNAIGNTLMIFADGSIQYVLWKKPEEAEEAYYLYLGDHIPHVQLSFGLVGELINQTTDYNSDRTKDHDYSVPFDKTNSFSTSLQSNETIQSQVTEGVMAHVNRTISENTIETGRFCFPFFVRYAIRLYDGSLVHHSAPILMNPSTEPVPMVSFTAPGMLEEVSSIEVCVTLVAASLNYAPVHTSELEKLRLWGDIVKGVDIYISKPIYTFNQSGTIEAMHAKSLHNGGVFIGRLFIQPSHTTVMYSHEYGEWDYNLFIPDKYDSLFELPLFDDSETVHDNIINNANFYKLYSIEEEELGGLFSMEGRMSIPVAGDYLKSLAARQVMTDDYLTNDAIHADISFGYNSRMNIAAIERRPFKGFCPSSLFAFCNADIESATISDGLDGNAKNVSDFSAKVFDTASYLIKTYIIEDSVEVCSTSDIEEVTSLHTWGNTAVDGTDTFSFGAWFFYPNTNAYKMEIICTKNTYSVSSSDATSATKTTTALTYSVSLKPHDFLNGSYAFLGYERANVPSKVETSSMVVPISEIPKGVSYYNAETEKTEYYNADEYKISSINYRSFSGTEHSKNRTKPFPEIDATLTTSTSYPINVPNKVYSSEVNNPFYFPLNGINTIGSGEIRGLCSAAKALSQGQFGQFPLYAFTTDGVWALEVSSTGTFSAKQPITRDVCLSTDGITQLDSAVLFPSDRGLMVLSGSQAVCISDSINSEYPFNALDLPAFSKLHDMLGHDPLTDFCLPTAPFREFLTQCRMVYDYVHQRVFVYNPSSTYAYVYSLKSTQWGMTFSTIASDVNSYPEALANNKNSELVNFSERITQTDGSSTPVLYVTRPLKFAGADVLKTVDNVIQRGFFQKGHIATALYGSRDLIHWHLVWTSKDHYLRGFRGTPYKYFRIAGVGSLDDDESITGASVQLDGRLMNQPR